MSENEPEAKEDDELVYHDNVRPLTTGLYCFLNAERVCGAECMAFTTNPRIAQVSELSEQQAHCSLLANTDRVGRNVTILTQVATEVAKKQRIAAADRKREGEVAPATQATKSPFGGK